MITIGVDFHKHSSSFHVLDQDGNTLKRAKMPNDPQLLRDFIQSLPPQRKQLALEATRSWNLFYDSTSDLVEDFYLGHPKKMKAITQSETKHDKLDAEMTARLTQAGFLPQAYVCSAHMRQLRSLLRFRGFLVSQRRSIRNQVQTLLDRNLWPIHRPANFKNIFCKRGLQWLESIELPEKERFILNQALEHFHQLSEQISKLEAFISTQDWNLEDLRFLRTVPGFKTSRVSIYTVLCEVIDVKRFRKPQSLAYYAGLVPKEHSSGEKQYTGRLVKSANMHLRTALLESTLAAIRADKGLKAYYKQVKQRRGSGAGVVATARKLTYAIYHVLKEQRAYRAHHYFDPQAN